LETKLISFPDGSWAQPPVATIISLKLGHLDWGDWTGQQPASPLLEILSIEHSHFFDLSAES
jgi:hypothetical protein